MISTQIQGQLGPNVAAAASAAVAGCLRDPDVKGRRAAAQTLAQLGLAVTGWAPGMEKVKTKCIIQIFLGGGVGWMYLTAQRLGGCILEQI